MPESDLATITVEEAKQLLQSAASPAEVARLARAALQAQRLDLVTACLEDQIASGYINEQVRTGNVGFPLKGQIVIWMLRAPLNYWPRDPDEFPTRHRSIRPSVENEPFGSVFQRLLPGRSLTEHVFDTKDSRLALAAELEAAIAAGVGEEKPAAPATPSAEKENATSIPKAVPPPPATPHPEPPPLQLPPPAQAEPRSPIWPWLAGIAALLAIGALLFKRQA